MRLDPRVRKLVVELARAQAVLDLLPNRHIGRLVKEDGEVIET
ncbi:hypothetical protein [Bradyrhizobium sp. NAS80.1]|nr:hypothetical protein [Bradyrhizobium sp. NAS80.1]